MDACNIHIIVIHAILSDPPVADIAITWQSIVKASLTITHRFTPPDKAKWEKRDILQKNVNSSNKTILCKWLAWVLYAVVYWKGLSDGFTVEWLSSLPLMKHVIRADTWMRQCVHHFLLLLLLPSWHRRGEWRSKYKCRAAPQFRSPGLPFIWYDSFSSWRKSNTPAQGKKLVFLLINCQEEEGGKEKGSARGQTELNSSWER